MVVLKKYDNKNLIKYFLNVLEMLKNPMQFCHVLVFLHAVSYVAKIVCEVDFVGIVSHLFLHFLFFKHSRETLNCVQILFLKIYQI